MLRTTWVEERGSALPLMAIVLGGLALALSLVMVQADLQVRAARAQWAADGSARAAAAEVQPGLDGGGRAARLAASEVAEANGARIVSIEVIDQGSTTSHRGVDRLTPISPTVVVEVEIGGVRGRAAAAQFALVQS